MGWIGQGRERPGVKLLLPHFCGGQAWLERHQFINQLVVNQIFARIGQRVLNLFLGDRWDSEGRRRYSSIGDGYASRRLRAWGHLYSRGERRHTLGGRA